MPSGVYKRTEEHKRKMTKETKLKISLAQKGKPRPSSKDSPTAFKKGHTPWNKDTEGLMPEPRNKGKTNGITDYEHRLKSRYGSTLEEYNRIREKQNNCCAICGIHESELTRKLCVDHDHKTGKIRGLLCGRCNVGLGHAKDDIDVLQKMREYLDDSIKITSNIISGDDAILGMMSGIEMAFDLLKETYGGAGTNVIVEAKINPKHLIANDAWTIIKDVKVKTHAERIGLDFLKELTERQDRLSGDSRKTAILLCYHILKIGYQAKVNKLQLKRDLDALIPVIEKEIDKQTQEITVNDIANVATTAGENEATGQLLQEIYGKIGANGIIQPESSNTFETSYKFIDGVRFDGTGYLSPFMVHDEQAKKDKIKETKAIYENPTILVTKKKIVNSDDINPILKSLSTAEKTDFVIFTQDMDSNVASMLINIHQQGGYKDIYGNFHSMNILIIKAPVLWRDYVFEDFAKCTGATIVEDATGVNYKNLALQHLGTCDKIIVDADETILIGTKDITEHVDSLKAKGDNDSKLRLSWLTNKTAILKLGANSETDLSYKRLKMYDAIRSSELALKYGTVSGAGWSMYVASDKLPDTIAGNIMKEALKAPMRQIRENMGLDKDGFDGTWFGDKVVDSAAVVKSAIRNALGIASTILTASSIVYIPERTKEEIELEIMLGKQNPMNN